MAAKPSKSASPSVLRGWAIRGGQTVDVDGKVRHVGYIGRGYFGWDAPIQCLGMSIAIFTTREGARKAMAEGPKRRHVGRGPGGGDFVAFPNASVERVKITVEAV